MHVVCAACMATNNIPPDKDYLKAKCGKCQSALYRLAPVELEDANFTKYIQRNDLPVLVDFWASWCGPCQVMAPVFARVASQLPAVLFAKVNTEVAQMSAAQQGIRSIPTLVLYQGGKERQRLSGALNEVQLKQWLAQQLQH